MSQDRRKEDLKKLLAFLRNIIREPENSWFADELHSILPAKSNDANHLAKIEKYLGLNYNIDKIVPIIDFSFVKDDYTQEYFNADYREMLRCRFGTRSNKPEFSEYCRYALIVAERALNLYYFSLPSIREVIEDIKRHNPTAKFSETPKNIESISFSVKLWAFCNKFNLGTIKWQLDNVREVRNMSSHGQINQEYTEERFLAHRKELLSSNFPLKEDGTVNWNLLKENMVLWNIYESKTKNTNEHKQYIWYAWRRREPFDEIHYYLNALVSFISTIIHV